MQHERVELSSPRLLKNCFISDFLVMDGVSIIEFWASTRKPIAVLRRSNSPILGPKIVDLRNYLDFIEPLSSALVDRVINKQGNFHKAKELNYNSIRSFLVYDIGQPINPTSLPLRVFQ